MSRPRGTLAVTVDDAVELKSSGFAARWPRVTAYRAVEPDATEEEWLAARRRGVGASELAAVLGIPGAYHSPFSLWWLKLNEGEQPRSEVMYHGQRLEPLIGELFGERRPDLRICRPAVRLWQHPDHPWMLASPDFLAVTADGLVEPVEAKSDEGGDGWGRDGEPLVPMRHLVQVLAQCEVLGAERAHVVRFARKRLTVHTIEYDEQARQIIADALPVAEAFVASLGGANLAEPPVDGHPATERALRELYPSINDVGEEVQRLSGMGLVSDELADEFEAAHEAKTAAVAAYDAARNRMRAAMGANKYALRASNGTTVAERRAYKRRGYVVAPAEVDEIRRRT